MKDWMIISAFLIVVVVTAVVVFAGENGPEGTELTSGEAINTAVEPYQSAVVDTIIPKLEHGKSVYFIYPKARYRINGVLVSKKRYVKGFMSWLSPWDYAIIWGDAPNYLPYLEFEQMVRYCMFRLKSSSGVDVNKISLQMGNNHLIPATKNIRKALGKAKVHDLVSLEGFLVNVQGKNRKNQLSSWNTSLVRTDNGGGACEIIYVTKLRIENTVYE